MYKKSLTLIFLILFVSVFSYSQQLEPSLQRFGLSIGNKFGELDPNLSGRVLHRAPENGDDTFMKTAFILSPINPMLVAENKKVYFALTKELSVAIPFVRTGAWGSLLRIGAEYSYVFRSDYNSHIRAFGCVDLPVEAGDFAAIIVSPGAGYFTDTRKSGVFPQLSAGILAPFSDVFAANLYAKLRYTFMLKSEESNIFDLSAGIGIGIFPF